MRNKTLTSSVYALSGNNNAHKYKYYVTSSAVVGRRICANHAMLRKRSGAQTPQNQPEKRREISLCPASYACCKLIDRYLLPVVPTTAKHRTLLQRAKLMGQTDGRSPYRYIDPAAHTMRAVLIIQWIMMTR